MENIRIKKIVCFGIVLLSITTKIYTSGNSNLQTFKINGKHKKFYLFGKFKIKEVIENY